MIPAFIEGATRKLAAPADWNKDEQGVCGALVVRDEETNAGQFMVSAWEPTPEELAALLGGAKVYLHVMGRSHPPVMLLVGEAPSA
jgi:hypothetical protein